MAAGIAVAAAAGVGMVAVGWWLREQQQGLKWRFRVAESWKSQRSVVKNFFQQANSRLHNTSCILSSFSGKKFICARVLS